MRVSYDKIWEICLSRRISPAQLRKSANVSSATFTKLRKNQEVALSVLMKIADVLHCDAGDIMQFHFDWESSPIEVQKSTQYYQRPAPVSENDEYVSER